MAGLKKLRGRLKKSQMQAGSASKQAREDSKAGKKRIKGRLEMTQRQDRKDSKAG